MILCTFFLLLTTIEANKIQITISNRTLFYITSTSTLLNHKDAVLSCENLGYPWGLPTYQTNQDQLHEFMKSNNVRSAWLGVQKKVLPFWTWVNNQTGTEFEKEQSKKEPKNPNYPCAALDISVEGLAPVSCGHQGFGFICEMPKGQHCPEDYHRNSCFRKVEVWYIIACNSRNWYDARDYCKNKGGDLAVLNTPAKIADMVDAIISRRLVGECSWVFVGLTREEWVLSKIWNITISNNTDTNQISGNVWTSNEPRPKHNCAKISIPNHGWTTDDCLNRNPTICQNYGGGVIYEVPKKSESKQTPTTIIKEGGAALKLVAVIGLAILVVFLGILGLLAIRHIKQKRDNNLLKESVPLVPPHKYGTFKGVTVIMFSDGINDENKELNDVKIVDVKLGKRAKSYSGTSIAININKAFHQVIGNDDARKPKKNLRIVNFSTIYSEGKLPRGLEKLFKSSLEKDEFPGDVIYLPASEAPATKEMLEVLWKMRDKYVAMTAARRYSSEIPAAECIAVGITHYTDTMLTSGVLDFSLDETECKGVLNLEDGVAMAVGAVAGLVHKLKTKGVWKKYTNVGKTRLMRNFLIELVTSSSTGGSKEHTMNGFGVLKLDQITQLDLDKLKAASEKINSCLLTSLHETPVEEKDYKTKVLAALGTPDEPIRILTAATPIDKTDFWNSVPIIKYEGKDAFMPDPTKDLTRAVKAFTNVLPLPDGSEDKHVKFYEAPVYPARHVMDWYHWRNVLQAFLGETQPTPHIIFLAATNTFTPVGMRIQHFMRTMKRKCIIITNAIGTKGPVGPASFPSDSVIAVSRSTDEVCGSAVDFVVSDSEETISNESVEAHGAHSWASAMHAVGIAAIVLQRALDLGFKGDTFQALCHTNVMHNILREMCTHPNEHKLEDGFGELKPWRILHSDEQMKILIERYTNPKEVTEFWSGKNI